MLKVEHKRLKQKKGLVLSTRNCTNDHRGKAVVNHIKFLLTFEKILRALLSGFVRAVSFVAGTDP